MNIAVQKTPAEAAYLGAGALIVEDPARRDAFDRFIAMGLPHRRMEDWRWTDLRQLIRDPYPPVLAARAAAFSPEQVSKTPFLSDIRARLVLVDGSFVPELSTLPMSGEVEVAGLGGHPPPWLALHATTAEPADDPILAMNTAFMAGGVALRISGSIEAPIEIVSIVTEGEPRTVAGRIVFILEEGASASLVETHLGNPGPYVNSSVTEALLGPNSRLDRVKLQRDGRRAIHLSNFQARLGERAILRDCTVTSGAGVTRQQGFISFDGEHADAKIAGAYLLRDRQHCDTRLLVRHRVAHCTSREVFKCVLDEEARGIFQGKVVVERGAQKTDGKQSSHALLLSPAAEFDAKPELEIYADDVVCGHGATAGDLEEDHLFYLRSRGIPLPEARALLVSAFAAEAFEDIAHDQIRQRLSALTDAWLRVGVR
ncbi:MAG TPA: Fe-S cluster assembly protein SufD [Aestuariivirgaceae bacterium]|nr:Fe-S cluster assembly protein SufD [Aestuariivirgaceae bacterium]